MPAPTARTKADAALPQIKSDLFDQLEYIARRVRNWKKVPAKEKPFGGIQLICCGDFFQVLYT